MQSTECSTYCKQSTCNLSVQAQRAGRREDQVLSHVAKFLAEGCDHREGTRLCARTRARNTFIALCIDCIEIRGDNA